jgi:small subunit ribosomal protein S4
MGDPKKQRKKSETPRHPWRRDQLEVELKLIGEYGLRNKRELWRYKTMLSKVRGVARSLLGKSKLERAKMEGELLHKLSRLGVLSADSTLDDVLDLDIKDLLERRLQTIVFRAGLANSIHQARQLISHGHIAIGDRSVSAPGYLVPKDEESIIRYAPESSLNSPDHPIRKMSGSKAPKPAPPREGGLMEELEGGEE